MKGFDEYYDEAVEPGKRERAFAWATAIGLQDVDGLKVSPFLLQVARRNIEGEISMSEAIRLIDEYHSCKHKTKVSGVPAVLAARQIQDEYGSSVATAVTGLHRRNKNSDVGAKRSDDVVNDVVNVVVKLTQSEKRAFREIERDGRISAARLAERISVTPRQAQRLIATLKKKAGLRRRGSDKSGEWYFARPAANARRV